MDVVPEGIRLTLSFEEELVLAVLENLQTIWDAEHLSVILEFYDTKGIIPPTQCHRKGSAPQRYDIRVRVGSIRDYHWTAALVASLLFENKGFSR